MKELQIQYFGKKWIAAEPADMEGSIFRFKIL